MARKTSHTKTFRHDLSSWNFIMFLTLAFILLVVVLAAMRRLTYDVRSRAGLECPEVSLPRAEDCSTGWIYKRDTTNGCLKFFCED